MIVLKSLTLRRGVKVVLDRCDLTVHAGDKLGLVGRNGAGKSSLFGLVTGRLHADAGDISIPASWLATGALAEVEQSMPETDQGATDYVVDGDAVLRAAHAELAEADERGDGEAIAHAHMLIDEARGFDARARAQSMLLGLGFKREQLDAPVNSFSGGWRMRLQLARALMAPARLLLLDEPTNHLDLDALVWLEAWLRSYDGTMIVISHDREFLDAVTRDTVHVDEQKIERYGGNYSRFEETRAQRLALQQQAFGKQEERIAHLQKFIDRFKAKATKAKQAQSRVKALARMERIAPVLTAADFAFEFREPLATPNPMLGLSRVDCGYGENNIIVRGVDLTVMSGQRIGILGANGQGKSTLVKTIARTLAPLSGGMNEGKGLAIGYFAQQEMDLLDAADTAWQYLARIARGSQVQGPDVREQVLRNFLGQFSFKSDMVHQTVGTLSGGERARLVLAGIVWQRPNLLLLDEPTNHLDLTTREALSVALNEFDGTVMLVSHDRALLREVCDEFLIVTRGGVAPFDGDVDDYQRWLLDTSRAIARGTEPPPIPSAAPIITAVTKEPTPVPVKGIPVAAKSPAALSRDDRQGAKLARAKLTETTRPLRMEIENTDKRLAKLAGEKAQVEATLSTGTQASNLIADLGRELAHINAEIAMLEERWLDASTELERLKASVA
jgi:ATP-binding cassette, subfamily F, member 3